MRRYRTSFIFLLYCVLALPAVALAQRLEIGATAGIGPPGSEGSLIRWEMRDRRALGVHAGVWWFDRVETSFRIVWVRLPLDGASGYFVGCGPGSLPDCQPQRVGVIFQRVSPRRFMAGQVVYHFRRGSRLRPFAGGGWGTIDTSEDVRCEIAGCEALMSPDFRWGRRESSSMDPIFIGGVSYAVTDHLLARGAIHFHRFAGEDLSMFEMSLGVGYRF